MKHSFIEKVYAHRKKFLVIVGLVIVGVIVSSFVISQYKTYQAEQERIQQETAEREEARQQAIAEEEARKQREEEEKRRLEEEKRREEEEQRLAEERIKLESELPTLFQTAFDSYSNAKLSDADRFSAELDFLKKEVAQGSVSWLDEYETQYTEWRVSAVQAQVDRLIAEYEKMIAERPIYKIINEYSDESFFSGLYYAGYHDLDNNQIPELVLLTIDEMPSYGRTPEYNLLLEVYGERFGKIIKYGSDEIYTPYGDSRLESTRSQDNLFIHYHYHGYSRGSSVIDKYYTLQDKQLIVQVLRADPYFNETLMTDDYEYYEDDKKITVETFDSLQKGYTQEIDIYRGGNYNDGNHGILTEPVNRSIVVNGTELSTIGSLFMDEGYTLAPIRPVLEAMGIPVYVDEDMETVLASTKKDTLDIHEFARGTDWPREGDYVPEFNDTYVSEIDPRIMEGQMYTRIEPLVKLFGAQTKYSYTDRVLKITSNIPAEDQMTTAELEDIVNFSYEDAEQILAQLGYWISGSEVEWDARNYISNGTAFWEVYVLPFGVEYEAYDNGIVFVGNSIPVTVTSNGEVIW